MDIAGYIASIFIGISLGLIGAGGSILTVPVLVYLFGIDAVLGTFYSLFIVGTTSVIGSISYFKKQLVHLKTALIFGLPSIISVYFTRIYIVPAIPREIFTYSGFTITKNILLMLLFAILMIFASYSMIKKKKTIGEHTQKKPSSYPIIFAQGLFIGFITGLVGAGGGFLIIPVLVHFLKLPMKVAVGTSLVIISINSLAGFFFSLSKIAVDWSLLLSISGIAFAGILVGSYLSSKIEGEKLKPAFGWFVMIMGVYIIAKEILLK